MTPASKLSPEDRDYLIRTMIGEGGHDASEDEHASVAHTVLNRIKSDKYADNAKDIALHPGAFPSWGNNTRELLALNPDGQTYKRAASVADRAVSGELPDIGGGSTDHPSVKMAAAGKSTGDPLEALGLDPSIKPAPPPPNMTSDPLEALGAPPAGQASDARPNVPISRPKTTLLPADIATMQRERAKAGKPPFTEQELTSIGAGMAKGPANAPAPPTYLGSVQQHAGEALEQVKTGFGQMKSGQPATGVGNVVWGTAGIPGSILAGTDVPARKITGQEEAAQTFPTLLGMATPGGVGGKLMQKAAPASRAIGAAVNIVGPENIASGVARLRANPDLRPIDVWPELRQWAQGQAQDISDPKKVSVLRLSAKDSQERLRTAGTRYADETMGPTPNVKVERDRLAATAENAGKSVIQPALNRTGAVDMEPTIKLIDKMLTPAVSQDVNVVRAFKDERAFPGLTGEAGGNITPSATQQRLMELRRDLATDKNVLSDPKRLHEIQSDIRREAEELMTNPENRKQGRALYEVRQSIVDAIDAAGGGTKDKPGQYKQGLEQFRNAKDVQEFYEKGRKLLNQGGDEDRIEYWQHHWNSASDHEKDAARLGGRVAIDQKIQSARTLNPTVTFPDQEFVRARMELMYGKKETDKLLSRLQDAKDIADSNKRMFQGSDTARNLLAQKATAPRERKTPMQNVQGLVAPAMLEAANLFSGGYPGAGATAAYGLGGVKTAFQTIGRGLDIATNRRLVEGASATGKKREEFISALHARAFPHLAGGSNKLGYIRTNPLAPFGRP